MRSSSFLFSATTLLLLGAACGDDTSTSGSGGSDAASSSSGDASTTTGSPTSTTNGAGGEPGTGGEGGTDPNTTSAGGNGGEGGTGGDGSGGDGTGGGSGGGGGAGGEAASTFFGRVLFSNGYYGVDPVFVDGGVSGTFSEITSPGDPDGCTETVDGDCTLILCPPFEGDPQATMPRLAGDLTVDGTLVEAPIVYDEEFDYYGYYGSELIYAAGDELSVEATGDDVPAFTGSVVAPAHATLTSPSSADLTFSRDEDLDFTWDVEGTGGRLLASLDVYDDDGSYAILYCDWPMDDGAASMPAAFMAEMPPTDGAFLSLYDFAVTSVEAGDWVIEVAAQGTTQGDSESGTASFEGVVLE